jgi:four helix bundle protein
MKAEHRTSNIERPTSNEKKQPWDLEDRLLDFSARIIRLVESLPRNRSGNHLGGQLLRSGTSPLLNHGEAEAAESRADFIHKLRVSLKELRETLRCLRLVQRVPLVTPAKQLEPLINETDELIRIFVASIRTSESRRARS